MNGLIEILRNKEWAISPSYLHTALEVIRGNLRNHTPLAPVDKKAPCAATVNAEGEISRFAYEKTREGEVYGRYAADDLKVPFVNVMTIDGPITRDGGECTFGSKQMRDMLMECADNPFCMGHIFEVNTPGGSAWARHDFRQGIDYAHERGQRVLMHIDGSCFSMGMWLASMCDEVYVMNGADEVGSIGVLASFFSIKNGAHNQFDSEDFHEVYDPESFDKNRWYRAIVENDDDRELVADLRKTGEEFRSDIRRAFPEATEEMIHGEIYDASKVMGVFIDGINTLDDCIRRLFDIADGVQQPGTRTNYINSENMGLIDDLKALVSREEAKGKQSAKGATADVAQLNDRIAQLEQERDEARSSVATLTAERDNLQAQVTDLEGKLETEKNDHKAECDKHATELAEVNKQLETANATIAERDKEINDLKGQLGSHYQPGSRLNGKGAGEGKKEGEKTAEEQKQECREKLGWVKK